MCVFLKLNAKEKAVCWFCGCEEYDDSELVCAARVWRGILDCILLLFYFYFFFFFFVFLTYVLYKGRNCFVVTFSLPLSLPFDWTFKIWSMCLLFCFEWMLCCGVVCKKKQKKKPSVIQIKKYSKPRVDYSKITVLI